MSEAIQTCALLGRFDENTVRESAAALLPHLAQRGLTTLVQRTPAAGRLGDLAIAVDDAELVSRAQLAIVIGGDGSLLYAARLVAGSGIPLLGINRGRLGFLTDVMPQDMFQCVDAALEGRCEADHRPLLEARLIGPHGSETRTQLALNDVVLAKWETGRILDFETRIDGRYVNTPWRRRAGGGQRHRLHRLCAVLRRPHRRSRTRCAGRGAHLPAYAGRPAHRGLGAQHHQRRAARTLRHARPGHLRRRGVRRTAARRPARGPALRSTASRCCIRPATTTSDCCDPSCTGAAGAATCSADEFTSC